MTAGPFDYYGEGWGLLRAPITGFLWGLGFMLAFLVYHKLGGPAL